MTVFERGKKFSFSIETQQLFRFLLNFQIGSLQFELVRIDDMKMYFQRAIKSGGRLICLKMNLIGYHNARYKITVSVITNINVLCRKIVTAITLKQINIT